MDEKFGPVSVAAPVRDFKVQLVAACGWSARGGSQAGADELSSLLGGSSGASSYANMQRRSAQRGQLVQPVFAKVKGIVVSSRPAERWWEG